MRTNIVIDDTLMREALAVSGYTSKKGNRGRSLEAADRRSQSGQCAQGRGTLHWDGDLDEMRTDN